MRGVCVAAMVPSLTAVDAAGVPLAPGLLYGDERGRDESRRGATLAGMGSLGRRWCRRGARAPTASGPRRRWPTYALAG